MTTRRSSGKAGELQPRLLKLAVAAKYMSMSPAKLRAIVQRGELAVIRGVGNAPWLIDVREIDTWIEINKQVLS